MTETKQQSTFHLRVSLPWEIVAVWQMGHRTTKDMRIKLPLKNAMLIIQTHDITLIIGIAGLIKKKTKQKPTTVLVICYKQTENQF